MFKCCRCTSSKGSRSNTDSDSNDTPTASRKSVEAKADDKKEMSPKEIKANGDVPRTEETEEIKETPTESAFETETHSVTEIHPVTEAHAVTETPSVTEAHSVTEASSEQQDKGNGGTEDKQESGLPKAAEIEINKDGVNIGDTEEKSDSSTTEEKMVHEADEREEKPDLSVVKEKADLAKGESSFCGSVMREYEQVAEKVGLYNESQTADDGIELSGPVWDQADSSTAAVKVTPYSTKTNLYCNSGYIERTIDDGPDDEGDDSVFEAGPGENDVASKANDTTFSEGLVETIVNDEKDISPNAIMKNNDVPQVEETEVIPLESALAHPVTEAPAEQQDEENDDAEDKRDSGLTEEAEADKSKDDVADNAQPGCGEIGDREEYLEQLVNRLEDVTKRLEKVPIPSLVQTQDTSVQVPSPKSTPIKSNSTQNSPEPPSNPVCASEQIILQQPTSMSVEGFKDLLVGPVRDYIALSQKIGGDVATQSKLVEKAFHFQLYYVDTAASRAAPVNQSELANMLEPLSGQIQQIQEFREKNRGSPFFNHLSAISESIPALGWVTVIPTPAPFVKEMNDAGQFYTNRVLKDWKEKDKIHIDWCKAWIQTLTDLQQYIRQHHTTGLVWGKASVAPIGIPPPPPPSMPIGDVAPPMINDDRSALFAQINQGEDITKNLKKVTSEMQTHKNPSLRAGPAPFKAPAIASVTPMKNVLPANAPIDKAPVFTRDGKKWLVEYHKGENIVIDNVEMNNVVYMFRCQDSTLTVKGKVNSVVMDSCRKSSVVFDSLVSSIEFVNCQSVQMQVLGKVPTISIDKTDGCQMYLSADSLSVELITSKSSEMNVMVPKANGDYIEYPVPEQFKTTISPNGLNTMAVDSLG
ncbi:adenylyl cyclase-associated protein isoform X2 [Odontomachus brunneus]|uniref:adenylyl cyclase-associated protein isoform X2 n=1 Tax=Odontomachus brunneus TaxID=486640 RepID=UPI0013F27D19|nr:adenylyl cyclase-associated protein isoform X2 [Odontomachus brunneus]